MNKIYKYELSITDFQFINLPRNAVILHVGEQGDAQLYLWALVVPERHIEKRVIRIVGTGHPLEDDISDETHLGTVQMSNGLVWHVFEIPGHYLGEQSHEHTSAVQA